MRRAALLLATFAVIYVCNFFIPRLMPGDPLQYSSSVSGEDMTVAYNAEQLEQLRAYYGLDQPLLTQFGRTLAANLRGDLGQSIHYKQPVSTVILSRLPWTLGLMAFSTALSLPLAVGLALVCVRRPRVDKAVYGVFSAICQLPPYLVGLALLFLVAARVDWLPLSGGETAFARYTHFGQRLADMALHGLLPAVSLCVVSLPGYFSFSSTYDPTSGQAVAYGPIQVVSTLAWGLGYFGMPHILLRFMAIEDEKKLVLSRRIASIWAVVAMGVAILIGMSGLGMTAAGKLGFLAGSDSETVIVKLAGLISQRGIIPAFIAGLILAGILAATMSTADSQMLAAASSVSQNIVQDFLGIKLHQKQSLAVARLTILGITVLGIFLARDPNSSVFGIVSFAWAGFGGAFGAVTLCALFWKRSNWQGALAGMLAGGITIFVWKYLVRPLGGIWNIYELLPAFLVSLAAIVVVSLLTPAPSAQIQEEFEQSRKK